MYSYLRPSVILGSVIHLQPRILSYRHIVRYFCTSTSLEPDHNKTSLRQFEIKIENLCQQYKYQQVCDEWEQQTSPPKEVSNYKLSFFSSLFLACYNTKNLDLAKTIFELIRNNNLKPDNDLFYSYRKLLYERKDYYSILESLEYMKKHGVQGDFHNGLLMALRDDKEKLLEIYRLLKERQFRLKASSYAVLFKAFSTDLKMVLDFKKDMESENVRMSVRSIVPLINSLLNANEFEQITEIIRNMKIDRKSPQNIIHYNQLMDLFANIGEIDTILLIVQKIQEVYKDYLDVVSYNIIMKCYLRKRDFKAAIDYFDKLHPSFKNERIYTMAIVAYASLNDVAKAVQTYRTFSTTFPTVTTETYQYLIALFSETQERAPFALEIYKDMKNRSVQPNMLTYSYLSKAFIFCKDDDGLHTLLEEMKARDIKPDKDFSMSKIISYALANDMNNAMSAFRQFIDTSLAPTITNFNDILSHFTQHGEANDFLEVIQAMHKFNVKPDVNTFDIMIHVFERKDLFYYALQYFFKMQSYNIKPSGKTYLLVIGYFVKVAMYKQAFEIIDRLKQENIEILPQLYALILELYAINGDTQNCMVMLKEMKKYAVKISSIYSSVIKLFTCLPEYVETVLPLIKNDKQSQITHDKVVDLFLQFADAKECLDLILRRYPNANKPNLFSYKAIISMLVKRNEFELAHELYEEMKKHKIEPDYDTYNIMQGAYYQSNDLQRALNLLDDVKKHNIVPPFSIYWGLMRMLLAEGRNNDIKPLYTEMLSNKTFPSQVMANLVKETFPNDTEIIKSTEAALKEQKLRSMYVTEQNKQWKQLIDAM